jgi:integrase
MTDSIKNMAEHYTLEEIKSLKSMLDNVEKKKKQQLGNGTNIYKFSQEYKKYIRITFSSKYLSSVNISFKHLIKYLEENKNLDEITVKDIEGFKYYIMDTAPKGFVVYMRTLKAAFNIAIEWKYIHSNPFVKVKFKKGQKKKPVFITREELEKILTHTENEKMKDIFIFAFNTGCRLGEITQLRWQNIDFRKNIIIIGDELFTTKNEKLRIIPISSELLPILKAMGKKKRKLNILFLAKRIHSHSIMIMYQEILRKLAEKPK